MLNAPLRPIFAETVTNYGKAMALEVMICCLGEIKEDGGTTI